MNHVPSTGSVSFADRLDAARRLTQAVLDLRGTRPVVAAIPRGGVPMAAVLTEALEGDLDVLLVHKIGHPQNPEFAVGSVDEAGNVTRWNGFGLSDRELEALAGPEVERLRARRQAYARVRAPVDLKGRVVLVVDDGLATGATMLAAVRSARLRGASRVIAVTLARGLQRKRAARRPDDRSLHDAAGTPRGQRRDPGGEHRHRARLRGVGGRRRRAPPGAGAAAGGV